MAKLSTVHLRDAVRNSRYDPIRVLARALKRFEDEDDLKSAVAAAGLLLPYIHGRAQPIAEDGGNTLRIVIEDALGEGVSTPVEKVAADTLAQPGVEQGLLFKQTDIALDDDCMSLVLDL